MSPNDFSRQPLHPLPLRARSRRALALAAILVCALIATGSDRSADASPPRSAGVGEGGEALSGGSPYSDPEYYPLRHSLLTSPPRRPSGGPYSAMVGCVLTNCDDHPNGNGHNHWAVDFIADEGDPVHAAGGGILHIGNISYGCTTSGPRGGTWVWIDHGGGTTSKYSHLSSIDESLDGQFVGPRAQIGEVGRSGNTCGIAVNYLHFEIRRGGLKGTHLRFDQLKACRPENGATMSLPAAMDGQFDSWDDVPYRGPGVPKTVSSCIGTPWTQAPDRPVLVPGFGDQRAELSWSAPSAPVGKIVIEWRIFRPSSGQFSRPSYLYLDGAPSSHVIGGLTNGRRYLYRVAFHGANGYSDWSASHEVVPAGMPGPPSVDRLVATRTRIGMGWVRSDGNGRPIDSYMLAIRTATPSGWSEWRYTAHPGDSTSYSWFDLTPDTRYEVRVKGRTAIGSSPWSPSRTIRTGA